MTAKAETVWVTTMALDKGIRPYPLESVDMFGTASLVSWSPFDPSIAVSGNWHRTREAALAQADRMRTAEIARLRARIAELEAMNW